MRTELGKYNGKRLSLIAEFVRYGTKTGWMGKILPTILLENVKLNGKIITDHLWLVQYKQFAELDLKAGDIISFEARVKEYTKGYKGNREDVEYEHPISRDYKVSYPSKMKKLKINQEELR